LDNGNDNIYDVTVTVSDVAGLTDVQDLAITVTDEDEAPEITNNGSFHSNTTDFTENAVGNVIDWDSTDPDGESENGGGLTYILTGVDVEFFDLEIDLGILTFRHLPYLENPLDYDHNNIYDVIVTVFDAAGLADVQYLTIKITRNVNKDSDGDGLTDMEEVTGIDNPSTDLVPASYLSDPNNSCDPYPSISSDDCDGDGLINGEELRGPDGNLNTFDDNTDPMNPDSDGDGLTDMEEVNGIDDPKTLAVSIGKSDANDRCDPMDVCLGDDIFSQKTSDELLNQCLRRLGHRYTITCDFISKNP